MSDEIKKDVSCANGVKNLIDEKLSENLSSSTTPSKTLKQTPRRASTRRSTLKRDESQTQPLKEVSSVLNNAFTFKLFFKSILY